MTDSEKNHTPGVDRAKATARETKDVAAERGEALKDEARKSLHEARSRAEGEVERGKGQAASSVADTADALGSAASSARQGSVQQQLLSEALHGLSSVASKIDGKSLSEMVDGVSTFAHRNPVAFLGGMGLAGFALSRFARASARNREDAPYAKRSPTYGASAGSDGPGLGGVAAPVVKRPHEGDI